MATVHGGRRGGAVLGAALAFLLGGMALLLVVVVPLLVAMAAGIRRGMGQVRDGVADVRRDLHAMGERVGPPANGGSSPAPGAIPFCG